MRVPKFRSLSNFGWREVRELSLRLILPRGFKTTQSIEDLEHETFSLDEESGLYDPSKNNPFQVGTFRGFIYGPAVLWSAAGCISDPEGCLIRESFQNDHVYAQVRKQMLLKKYPLRESSAPYVTSISHIHRNYFHKHIDSIPRLYGLHHPRLLALPEIELVLDPRFSESELDIIRLIIPENVRITIVPFTSRVKVKKYIHLPFLSGKRHDRFNFNQNCGGYLPQDYLDYYRNIISDHWNLPKKNQGGRVFISRSDAKIRRLLNNEEVKAHLAKFGFTSYEMEGLSVEEQARLFASSSVIFTTHGAALTNLLYANSDLTLIEVFAKQKLPIFSTLAIALGVRHISIRVMGKDKNSDVHLPLEKIDFALERAGLVEEPL